MKQFNNLKELHNHQTNYFPVWLMDQNDNQGRIEQSHKSAAFDKLFKYLVSKGWYSDDFKIELHAEEVADKIIDQL